MEGYKDRIRRIALFDPLYRLERKSGKDNDGKDVDYLGLGLLSLLFFFENMLMRNQKVGIFDLAGFLRKQIEEIYNFQSADIEKVSRMIIEEFRPPSGKKREKRFLNWETKVEEEVRYSILKASGYDATAGLQYYILDDDGLELVFATREFYAEFSLSINQLLLRKQLEKGEFASALRQIDEMRMDVVALQERIIKISHEIQRSIISDETYVRFKIVVEDLNSRLGRENDEFKELKRFVEDTQNRLLYEIKGEKERQAYEKILEISIRLAEVHYEHSELFQQGIQLKTTALRAAQQSLYYVGINAFNFREQVVGRVMSLPLPVMVTEILVKPFLYVEQQKKWSLLTVFGEQRVEKNDRNTTPEAFLDIENDEIQETYRQRMAITYKTIVVLLIRMIKTQNLPSENGCVHTRLELFIQWLADSKECPQGLIEDRSFYEFWMICYQRTPITAENKHRIVSGEIESNVILEPAVQYLANWYSCLSVEPGQKVIKDLSGYTIKDMLLTLTLKEI